MNRINPEKLMLSKWTAIRPQNREKHFVVISCQRDEDDNVTTVEIEAVLTRRSDTVPWQCLQDASKWRMGWG
ncbi:TIGR02450 family Trp-rich protein [uncultured Halopseudomonas sp.]|uniref:TIGR02450 family Trp-rich protein n=1 Tax=uncultured Halopseudomonas sp. TaxID=2901193 RepID=UPI0030ED1DB3